MIKYALKCGNGHEFESWFLDSAAFDKVADTGLLQCAVCGGTDVKKAIMAPRIGAKSKAPAAPQPDTEPQPANYGAGPLSEPLSNAEAAMKELRRAIEANSDNVGKEFAKEARAIHYGEAPERSIIGQADKKDVADLIDEGVPVAPLPWSRKQSN